MSIPSPGYAVTIRVELPATTDSTGDLTAAVSAAGAALTALDVVESTYNSIVVDVTCNATDENHAKKITDAIAKLPGVKVRKFSDRTFLIHLGGKLEVNSKVPLKTRDDLSRAYTPGVARISQAIAEDPTNLRRLTIKRNSVAVVTDGSAVLGLGNLGAAAALPVMEGKAALFKRFADIDAWPVCIDSQDVDEIVRTVQLIAPVYGGINLEDISAPRCFEVEKRLRELLDIPVFHDDQHGTAIVVLAALTNALRVVNKKISDIKLVMTGAGAAGTAIARLLVKSGLKDLVVFNDQGVIHKGVKDSEDVQWLIENTNKNNFSGSINEALKNADVFIGVSAPNILTENDLKQMNKDAIIFALANPNPEVDPILARKYAKVVATGRSDFPNQINNVLAFPGIFRGLLDAQAKNVTEETLMAAAQAIANRVSNEQLNASFIVPSVFDPGVTPAVAQAVRNTLGK
ncbi:MAG: NAD-dependent malic enzyme [Candidatus Nanopelagicales bacterium]|jgi:malate dehydrogenase (oxaloacetate-decarboxylating)